MGKREEQDHLEEERRLASLLFPLSDFLSAHPQLSMMEFEYDLIHKLTLFTVKPSLDFAALSKRLDEIALALPALKRIFAKPQIHLKDQDDVLPVETVRRINQASLLHLANHCENVANLTEKGVRPRSLLTQIYEDDYGLYENLIFCDLIDEILHWIRHYGAALKNLLYAKENLEFNLLERSNHLNYFFTIGKLQTGYVRDFAKYYTRSKALYRRMEAILNVIQPRLKRPVYRKNKNRGGTRRLKKTNIFLMQKDYRQVYRLYKKFLVDALPNQNDGGEDDPNLLGERYFRFVSALTVFAYTSFNFEVPAEEMLDFRSLDNTAHFKDWSLHLQNEGTTSLVLSLHKESDYRIRIVPWVDIKTKVTIPAGESVDETLYLCPFEEDAFKVKASYVSIEDIDSFRRIQQALLRAMVLCDQKRDECPFCQGDLALDENGVYACEACHTEIHQGRCAETGKTFFYTTLGNLSKHLHPLQDYEINDPRLLRRQIEATMFFRNITPINERGEILCPICGQVHPDCP